MTKLVIAITRGLIRDSHTRRMVMFVLILLALVMLFAGATFLNNALLEQPKLLLCYWVVCAWLTVTASLLAIFDLLALRALAARERRKLRTEIFDEKSGRDV
jgi:hypothetical protein